MKLGIPTLCRYDLLVKLLQSIEKGSELPSGYIIIDNGGNLTLEQLKIIIEREVSIQLISPGENWGVARSWNHILELVGNEPVVISNDDIVFGHRTFQEISSAAKEHTFVEGLGWALFAQGPECIARVGWYDCNFYPAYYEDNDYDVRLKRAGIRPFRALSEPVEHFGWATTRGLPEDKVKWLNEMREKNRQYFLQKWGHIEGLNGVEHYSEAFNGNTPTEWKGERIKMSAPPSMRWEIINHIAEKIEAKRYLEIGVCDGTSMRNVNISEKWGVDPQPQIGAVNSAAVFIPQTSDDFFKKIGPNVGKFDIIFIDGDHRSEQAYRDVQNAIKLLSQKGVILLHDCNPHTEAMQIVPSIQGEWTGDVWKAIAQLRSEGQHSVRVVSSDYGVGIVIPNLPETNSLGPANTWLDLERDRTNILGLLAPSEWSSWFSTTCSEADSLSV
jgi:GT2 family glycosyltransferase